MSVELHVLPNHSDILFAGVSISSLWPATAIKAFVTDKLGTPPSVMRTPDIFADAVLGIAEEKSDKWVLLACIRYEI